jgi:xylitol oxidase
MNNWAGNLSYSTDRLSEVSSVDQVRAFVESHDKLKVLGTRHCFNSIADSREAFLSLRAMNHVLALDPQARTVTVEAGMSYAQLCPYIEDRGFALHNLASLPHISVAGGVSTATHGSGEKSGNLATAVSAIELVTATGDLVKLSRASSEEEFNGAVVGLGALGVITSITLDIEPTYAMWQRVYKNLPFSQMKEHFDEIQSSGYSVSLFTCWQRVDQVWIKSRIGDGLEFAAPSELFGAPLAAQNLHPIEEVSPENCTEQMGVPGPWYERLPHFRIGFTPSAGQELQSEYFVPRRNAVDAILAIERLRDQVSPHLLISEIRSVAADDLWMSPSCGRPSVAIHFTWKPDWPAVRQVLPVIERELAPFQARPHWGKLFTMSPGDLQSRYERLADFTQLAAGYDPKGKFRNNFLITNLFA